MTSFFLQRDELIGGLTVSNGGVREIGPSSGAATRSVTTRLPSGWGWVGMISRSLDEKNEMIRLPALSAGRRDCQIHVEEAV